MGAFTKTLGWGVVLATVAAAAIAGPGVTVLHSFNYADGQYPEGRLLFGSDGRIYGTTYAGGSQGYGTVFAVGTDKVHQILHSFGGVDGNSLDAGLIQAADGTLFGTTPQGSFCVGSVCTGFGGSVFEVGADGSGFTTLRRFTGDGAADGREPGALVDGGDGYFYGTARAGGVDSVGSVFKLAPDGTLGTIASFDPATGAYPGAMLTRGSDGNFYGSLRYGPGNNDQGALFRLSPAGGLTVVHAFDGSDGNAPSGALLEVDGAFYGVTSGGGPGGGGTVFRLAGDGSLSTLYAFNGTDGSSPVGPLVRAADGNLVGLTFGGGADGGGTLFRISTSGNFMTLHRLTAFDGTHPVSGPVLGGDGLLYASTTQYGGGTGASGSVFQFDPLAAQPAELEMKKFCYNEFDLCFRPINTTVGQPYDVVWSSANLTSCVASGAWNGSRPPGGRLNVVPTQHGIYTYRLRCTGPGGASKTASVTVTVA